MDVEYPYWLVTKGKAPNDKVPRGYTPLLLLPRAEVTLRELAQRALADAKHRATILLVDKDNTVDVLKEMGSAYMADHLSNLWVSQVRLTSSSLECDVWKEEATLWRLVGHRQAPRWQGPADGVIPRETPVTVRSRALAPFKLEGIDG